MAERIELVEDLWDSIAADAESVPVPESHRRELARRRAAHHEDPTTVRPWEEVRERLWAEEWRDALFSGLMLRRTCTAHAGGTTSNTHD